MRICVSICAASLLTVFGLVGCGNSVPGQVATIPIKGTITLDGQPFGPARLLLRPDNDAKASPSALVDDKGNVVITTYSAGDGAPAGTYKVSISGDPTVATPAHPRVYDSADTSTLSVTVSKDGAKEFTLAMDSKAGPSAGGTMGVPLGAPRPAGADPAAAFRNAAPTKP